MISHPYRCIFIHIPRTGGSSIEAVVWGSGKKRQESDLWMGFVDRFSNKYQTGGLQHLRARQVIQEVGRETWDAYYTFAFVRNCWDKAVSQYHYMMQRRADLREFVGLPEGADFKAYLEATARKEHVQWLPQFEFLVGDDGALLVDDVFRFEQYAQQSEAVLDKLGAKYERVPHTEKTERDTYVRYYDDESRERVAELYAEDIRRFGFRFGEPSVVSSAAG